MNSRYGKYILIFVVGLGVVVFWAGRQAKIIKQKRDEQNAIATAVQGVTDDASRRMREALSANIAARALALSEAEPEVAILVAIEALNVLKRTDTLPHAAEHAVCWLTALFKNWMDRGSQVRRKRGSYSARMSIGWSLITRMRRRPVYGI